MWGDVPAWVAIGLTAVGGIATWRANRNANKASESAAEARAGTASLEESLEKIAQIMAARPAPAISTSSEPPRRIRGGAPPVAFNIEYAARNTYRLRNLGPMPATRVTVSHDGIVISRDLPNMIDMPPMMSVTFMIIPAAGVPVPGELIVYCEELAEPAIVPLPPQPVSGSRVW